MKRHATAHWEGAGKDGNGTLTTQSGTLDNTRYSFAARFENGPGTNPDELIAAAHAGCFTMKLSFLLQDKGLTAKTLDSKCTVTLEDGSITSSHIDVKVAADGLSQGVMEECVNDAFQNCIISKVLATKKTVNATLVK